MIIFYKLVEMIRMFLILNKISNLSLFNRINLYYESITFKWFKIGKNLMDFYITGDLNRKIFFYI